MGKGARESKLASCTVVYYCLYCSLLMEHDYSWASFTFSPKQCKHTGEPKPQKKKKKELQWRKRDKPKYWHTISEMERALWGTRSSVWVMSVFFFLLTTNSHDPMLFHNIIKLHSLFLFGLKEPTEAEHIKLCLSVKLAGTDTRKTYHTHNLCFCTCQRPYLHSAYSHQLF